MQNFALGFLQEIILLDLFKRYTVWNQFSLVGYWSYFRNHHGWYDCSNSI